MSRYNEWSTMQIDDTHPEAPEDAVDALRFLRDLEEYRQ